MTINVHIIERAKDLITFRGSQHSTVIPRNPAQDPRAYMFSRGGGSGGSVAAAGVNFTQTDVVLGRSSAGAGPGQEIPCTSTGRSLIAAASIAAARTLLLAGALTIGSVAFGASDGTLGQDNASFFWDNTAKLLRIGAAASATTATMLDVRGSASFQHALVVVGENGSTVGIFPPGGAGSGAMAISNFQGDLSFQDFSGGKLAFQGAQFIVQSSGIDTSEKVRFGNNLAIGTAALATAGMALPTNSLFVGGRALIGVAFQSASATQQRMDDGASTLQLYAAGSSAAMAVYSIANGGGLAATLLNYERLRVFGATGVMTLAAESAGTGSANMDIAFTPKGTGRMKFGSFTSSADVAVTGSVDIKTSDGTTRKLAVIA